MKENLEKFKAWFSKLSLREKQAVSIGSVLLGIFIIYEAIWSPYLNHIQNMRQRIIAEQKNLLWMQSADKVLDKMNHSATKTPPVSVVVFLSQMQKHIDQAGLASFLTQLKQSTNDSIEMHFQKVEFNKLMAFMIDVMQQRPVLVLQFSVTTAGSPGIVNADLVMSQG